MGWTPASLAETISHIGLAGTSLLKIRNEEVAKSETLPLSIDPHLRHVLEARDGSLAQGRGEGN